MNETRGIAREAANRVFVVDDTHWNATPAETADDSETLVIAADNHGANGPAQRPAIHPEQPVADPSLHERNLTRRNAARPSVRDRHNDAVVSRTIENRVPQLTRFPAMGPDGAPACVPRLASAQERGRSLSPRLFRRTERRPLL